MTQHEFQFLSMLNTFPSSPTCYLKIFTHFVQGCKYGLTDTKCIQRHIYIVIRLQCIETDRKYIISTSVFRNACMSYYAWYKLMRILRNKSSIIRCVRVKSPTPARQMINANYQQCERATCCGVSVGYRKTNKLDSLLSCGIHSFSAFIIESKSLCFSGPQSGETFQTRKSMRTVFLTSTGSLECECSANIYSSYNLRWNQLMLAQARQTFDQLVELPSSLKLS